MKSKLMVFAVMAVFSVSLFPATAWTAERATGHNKRSYGCYFNCRWDKTYFGLLQLEEKVAVLEDSVDKLADGLDQETMEKLEKMSDIAVAMFETAIESLFREDYALAESIVEKTKQVASLEKEAVVSSQKIDVEDAPHIRLIIESIRRVA